MALPCGQTPVMKAETLLSLQYFIQYKDSVERHADWPLIQSQLIVHYPEIYNQILIWKQAMAVQELSKLAVLDCLKVYINKLEDVEGP